MSEHILYATFTSTDMFAEETSKDPLVQDSDENNHEKRGPLPQGWSEKIDHHTGRPYYEW